jgi:hypothetical protein
MPLVGGSPVINPISLNPKTLGTFSGVHFMYLWNP